MRGTITLTDFLLARIAEDEAEAKKIQVPVRNGSLLGVMRLDVKPHDSPGSHDGPAVAIVVSPTRVLAECQAKRQIVERHRPWDLGTCSGCGGIASYFSNPYAQCPDLLALAAIYADHPDYREEWRP